MATSMLSLGRVGQSWQGNFLFTVSKTTGSCFSQRKFTNPQVKSFSTTIHDKGSLINFGDQLYKKRAIGDESPLTQRAINYIFPSYAPYKLPKELMRTFGFDPENAVECPILTTPPIEQMGPFLSQACPKEKMIYTGIVNASKFGSGDSHFYVVFANTGNVEKMAAITGLPLHVVRQKISSPVSVLAQWAGSIMAGGGALQLDAKGEGILKQITGESTGFQDAVIGRGDLTVGRDQVEISRPERVQTGGATMFSFLARTMYFHALSGSVLHMQYVSGGGDIYWGWVGAGGKGFNSREVNNFTAIDLNLGMWPDLANSLMGFYSEPELLKLFLSGDPEDYQKLITLLVTASTERKGTILDLLQRAQVSLGFGKRIKDSLNNGAFQVKGDK